MLALNSQLTVGLCPHRCQPGFTDAVADFLTGTLSELWYLVNSSMFYHLFTLYFGIEVASGVTLWAVKTDDCPELFKFLVVALASRFGIVMAQHGTTHLEQKRMRVCATLMFGIVSVVALSLLFPLKNALAGRPITDLFILFAIATGAINIFLPLFVVVMLVLVTAVTMPCFMHSYRRRQRAAAISRDLLVRMPTSLPIPDMEPGAPVHYGSCRACQREYTSSDLVKTFPCGHRFHSSCAFRRLSWSATCPECGYVVPCPLC